MSVRLTRRYAAQITALEAEDALRQVAILSVVSPGMDAGQRRRLLDRWQHEAIGGQRPPPRVLTPDELRALSRVGG